MSQNQPSESVRDPNAEPTVGSSSVPISLILALGALLFWGSTYLDSHGGGFDQQVFAPYNSHVEVAEAQPYDPNRAFIAEGEAVFNATCAACHQANGQGKDGQFPPLAGSDWLSASTPTRIGRIVLRGLNGSIRVEAGGKTVILNGTMPPQIDTYDDEHLAAVLTYVRQAWGNNYSKIKPEEIKALRDAVKSHPGQFNPDELQKIPLEPPK